MTQNEKSLVDWAKDLAVDTPNSLIGRLGTALERAAQQRNYAEYCYQQARDVLQKIYRASSEPEVRELVGRAIKELE